MVGLVVDVGLRPRLHRGRPDPAQGSPAGARGHDGVRRRRPGASATQRASCTRRCSSGTSRSPVSDPSWRSRGPTVNLEFTIDHHYEQVGAYVARLPLFNPARKTAMRREERPMSMDRVRRDRHRGWPQRPGQRRLPRQGRAADADPRAPPPRRRRGDHRGAAARLPVHDVLATRSACCDRRSSTSWSSRSTASCRC